MIRDVYLDAGDCLAVNAWRFGQSTGQMLADGQQPGQACAGTRRRDTGMKTLRYTASRAGWYGFVISNLPTGIPDQNTTVQYQRTSCSTV